MFTKFTIISFNIFEVKLCTEAIVKLEKNNKRLGKIRKCKQQVSNEKEIYDLYQPLIDKVIYIDDQLILESTHFEFENQQKHAARFCSGFKFGRVYN
jgi:hypothetical protein